MYRNVSSRLPGRQFPLALLLNEKTTRHGVIRGVSRFTERVLLRRLVKELHRSSRVENRRNNSS